MIKKEVLKQAIDSLSRRRPEVGYTLGEMLAAGRIDSPPNPDAAYQGDDFYFLFDDEPVLVRRYLFFSDATAAVAQRLLIKYGETAKKNALQRSGEAVEFTRAADQIREAGQRMLVNYEIDRAADRLAAIRREKEKEKTEPAVLDRLTRRIQDIRKLRDFVPVTDMLACHAAASIRWKGLLESDVSASFVHFPFCMDALMQVAEMNLEFFHPRMLLQLYAAGGEQNVLACMVGSRIHGLVELDLRKRLLYQGLEIKYIATRRGGRQVAQSPGEEEIHGVGLFLIGGVWLLWKQFFPKVREIVLDSEVAARRFYETGGFETRGMSEYVLRTLSPRLLRNAISLAAGIPDISRQTLESIFHSIEQTVGSMRRRHRKEKGSEPLEPLSLILSLCMHPSVHPSLLSYLLAVMSPHTNWPPPMAAQLQSATALLADRTARENTPGTRNPVPIVHDQRFSLHLENVMHLENPKRVAVFDEVLHHPSLAGKWTLVPPKMATEEELSMVHTKQHIDRIRASAGLPLTSFDIDTQASESSYDTARLAAGSVLALIDAAWAGPSHRGFAFVRPPGHHAEPDRAMGFCLFNNVALGAMYLRTRLSADRILIIDLDAHHGNGTQKVFYSRPDVLFISLHQFPGFPGTGALGEIGSGAGTGFTINVPLGSGTGEKEYAQVLNALIRPVACSFAPQMILVSMGFDLYLHDRLGSMRVTPGGYATLTAMLLEIAEQAAGGKIVFVMEGGYSLKGIRECGLRVMQEICGIPSTPPPDMGNHIKAPRFSTLAKILEIHKPYWPVLG